MSRALMEGSEAIAESAIVAGCRFFAGYPMSPFTELLEHFAAKLPERGGVCINADSEMEAVNMAIGAAATGARAATGSCGQGLALMQEAIAEAALNETPLVVFNLGRNQQDYFQATRGGGWGDYRTITLAPKDVQEAAEQTQLLFHLADQYRAPVILYGDHLISNTYAGVDVERRDYGRLPPKDWALDGTKGGTGESRMYYTWATGKTNNPGPGPDRHWRAVAEKFAAAELVEARWEAEWADGAETVVVAFGTAGKFVQYVVDELRAEGVSIGSFRPISLWPFPRQALADATAAARRILVFELNAGQMLDDVHLSVERRERVRPIGGVSVHESGLRHGALMDAPVIREKILAVLEG
jgi:2-oxoglutarate ferredoxin oxidoreductase subunit alpha